MGALFHIQYSRILDRYCIGHTTEPMEERLRKHLANHKHWTGRAKDRNVAFSEIHPDRSAACRREREVKAWKRRKHTEQLIAGTAR